MLPDFGWSELLVIAIVLIVIVGPKDLPKMLRTFGKTTSNLRKMAGDFRRQFDEALKEAELDDVRKIADDMRGLDPRNQIKDVLNPLGKVGQDISSELKKATTAPTPEKPKSGAETAVDGAGDKTPAARDTSKAGAKKPTAAKPASAAARKSATRKPAAKTAAAKTPARSASAKSASTKSAPAAKATAAKTAAKATAKPKAPAKPAAARTASAKTAGAAKPKARPKAKKPAAEDKS